VQAVFTNLDAARAAMDELEGSGIDAGKITLEGAPAERAATRSDTRRRDARLSRHVGAHFGLGLIVGAVAGGGIGVFVAAIAASAPLAIVLAGVAGVVAGGAIGGMIGGVSSMDVTPDWELTFDRATGSHVAVEVSSDDPQEIDVAVRVLQGRRPIELKRTA